jgi:hypothetical protein
MDMQVKEVSIEETIEAFFKEKSIVLHVLTPCYGGVCYTHYFNSLMASLQVLQKYNVKVVINFCNNDSLVSRARNNLVARSMNDPTMTHMVFIDADIVWSPYDIIKLLMADKPIVGGAYPKKNYNWSLLKDPATISSWLEKKNASQLKETTDEDTIQFKLLDYNINYLTNEIKVNNNLTEVRHIANGFCMIKRDVIEKMRKAFPTTKYVDDIGFLIEEENKHAYALFDCGVEDGHYLSEDWMFCHRWKKMGGSIWLDISIQLSHIGVEVYKGSYIHSLAI